MIPAVLEDRRLKTSLTREHVFVFVFSASIVATETIQSLYSSPSIKSSWFSFSKMFLGVPMMPPGVQADLFSKRKGRMVYKCTYRYFTWISLDIGLGCVSKLNPEKSI